VHRAPVWQYFRLDFAAVTVMVPSPSILIGWYYACTVIFLHSYSCPYRREGALTHW
jgi:hypothetical protein